MMKKIIISVLAIVLVISFTACSMFASTTQKYMNALNNTVNAESMQVQTKYTMNMDLSKAPESVRKDFESFKEVSINTDQWIDNKNKKSETRSFTKAGEIMPDSKIYADNGKVYLKSSMLGDKYIDLASGAGQQKPDIDEKEFKKFSDELVAIWKTSVQNELLATEGNSIENTPDGDIKVSISTLQLNDEKAKNILRKIAELVSRDGSIARKLVQNSEKFNNNTKETAEGTKLLQDWLKNLPEEMDKNKDKFAIENLKLTAKIDKDSYVIDETLEGSIVLKFDGEIRINFNSHTTRWNINTGKVHVNIPEIKSEDILDVSKLKQDGSNNRFSEEFKKLFEKMKKQ